MIPAGISRTSMRNVSCAIELSSPGKRPPCCLAKEFDEEPEEAARGALWEHRRADRGQFQTGIFQSYMNVRRAAGALRGIGVELGVAQATMHLVESPSHQFTIWRQTKSLVSKLVRSRRGKGTLDRLAQSGFRNEQIFRYSAKREARLHGCAPGPPIRAHSGASRSCSAPGSIH